ncbi:MAG: hypothetical protein H6832_02120 [Planctomycetes bacterium]|nr:hypothetical protein [Planctomycetota bacterium]MCB9917185.1 hypothetical protein [Planctomycetota bacterium]
MPNTYSIRFHAAFAAVFTLLAIDARAQADWTKLAIDDRASHAMVEDPVAGRIMTFGGINCADASNAETWIWASGSWSEVTTTTHPSARIDHAMALDTTRNRVVLFGGSSPQVLGDTWEWNGSAWTKLTPKTSPPARFRHALAYDEARKLVVMFGGVDAASQPLTDTWVFDGQDWKRETPTTSPTARSQHAMTYDVSTRRVMLAGGRDSTASLAETWTWDGRDWTLFLPLPAAVDRPAMTYDRGQGTIVLFDGGTKVYESSGGLKWLTNTPKTDPGVRWAHALAYDANRKRVLLFGGNDRPDSWEYDGTDWSLVAPDVPEGRRGPVLAHDALRDRTLLFGGRGCNTATPKIDDTWEFDGSKWIRHQPVTKPGPRWASALVYDSMRRRFVLFGGLDGSNNAIGDTWLWDGTAWTRTLSSSSPSARAFHAMAFDVERSRAVLFGGIDVANRTLADTWTYDGTNWSQRSPANAPPAMSGHGMAYDPVRKQTLLVGNAQTWIWDGIDWSRRTPNSQPPNGASSAMSYDAVRDRTVLFVNGETWDWDGQDWQKRTPLASPVGRGDTAMTYVAGHGRVLLFGGSGSGTGSFSDLWAFATQDLASFTPFGSACPSSNGTPRLQATPGQRPWLAATFEVEVVGIPTLAPVLWTIGASKTVWGPFQLPLDLGAIGMPTCKLLASPDIFLPLVTIADRASAQVPIPNDLSLRNAAFHSQAFIVDAPANAVGLVLSNGATGDFGVR